MTVVRFPRREPPLRITKQQQTEMLQAAKPLMSWLAQNTHPHCKAIVGMAHIELLEGLATNSTLEFVEEDCTVPYERRSESDAQE